MFYSSCRCCTLNNLSSQRKKEVINTYFWLYDVQIHVETIFHGGSSFPFSLLEYSLTTIMFFMKLMTTASVMDKTNEKKNSLQNDDENVMVMRVHYLYQIDSNGKTVFCKRRSSKYIYYY